MKKLLILLILLLTQIITGCKSIPKADIVLPPKPQREKIAPASTVQDLANIINYYEHLVQEWEEWGDCVFNIIGEIK